MTTTTSEQTPEQLWEALDTAEASGTPVVVEKPTAEVTDATPANADDKSGAVEAAAAATAEAQPDPYAGLPEAVKQELAGYRSIIPQLQTRLRNAEGHIGGLTTQLKDAKAAAQAVRESGGAAPTNAQIAQAGTSSSKLAKLREDFPEFAEAIEEVASTKAPVAEELAEIRKELNERKEQEAVQARYHAVELSHPGWQREVAAPKFIGWLQAAPPELQVLAASNDPALAVRLLDIYKAQAAPAATTSNKQALASAAAIPNRGVQQVSRQKPESEMTAEELWAHLDAQDRASNARK